LSKTILHYFGERVMRERYFFLYLKTGGGHLAPAKSVSSYLSSRYPDSLEPVLIDGFEEAPKAVRSSIEGGYKRLQAHGRWIYALMYFMCKWEPIARLTSRMVSFFVRPYLEKRILSERPQKIVIFHFFLIRPVAEILRRHRLSVPTLVVVTDPFTAHPVWFLDKAQKFVVFSAQLRDACVRRGIRSESISVFPFVLNEKFGNHEAEKAELATKEELGFDPDKRLILVLGGADGIPKGVRIVKQLSRKDPGAEIAVVCGRNIRLKARLEKLRRRNGLEFLKIFGYVNSVHEMLRISDVVITKCGASVCMETLMTRKIPIVNNYLWEQEKGNVDFLCDNRIGIYESNTRKISALIDRLFTDSHFYDLLKRNIEAIQLVNGVNQVSDYILRFTAA
jgi:processive 1,2-diacylglycerol beta-glucosyltransferase/1,2-diacylglycerol 3-beta-galactosyltransferase